MVEAIFAAANPAGIAPLTVVFSVTERAGDPLSYLWDFGDGTTSTLRDPEHVYQTTGAHTVILRITDTEAVVTTIRRGYYINVGQLDFDAVPSEGGSPLTVQFTSNNIIPTGFVLLDLVWDFGDDSADSTEENPVHTYTVVGDYNVSLSARLVQL